LNKGFADVEHDVYITIVVYYAKMAAESNIYIKYTKKYKDKKAEMHDKVID